MKISGILKLTLLDFPGEIAATIFTPGCNFRCPFCHNSDIVLEENEYEYYEDEVMEFLKSRKGKLSGIAITGGEPCLQKDLKEFIKRVRELGFKIKLDTNGSYPERLKEILDEKLVDYVAMDIKNSKEGWAETVGLSKDSAERIFNNTLLSIKYIQESGIKYEFRTTIVRELHNLESFEPLVKLIEGSNNYYIQSFKESGKILKDGYSACDKDTLLKMLEIAKKYVKNAELRGID